MLVAGWAAAAAVQAAAAQPPALDFDRVFNDRGEPGSLHYEVRYGDPRASHRLEVWRDGSRRLVRRTDDAIETHVARAPGEAGYQMVVLDLRRRIETRIARDDLYRIGNFTDWFDLAHGLRHPKAGYRLAASVPPKSSPSPLEACNWYTLAQGTRLTTLCWSTRTHLPLLMLDESGSALWQVTRIESNAVARDVFELHDLGFVRSDAGQDISGD